MRNATEIEGVIAKVVHHDDGDDFWVARLRDKQMVIGTAPEVVMQEGLTFRFWGKYESHPKYGKRFKFTQCLLVQPYTQESIVAYLMRYGSQVGKGIALRLYKAFGSDTLDVVRERTDDAIAATDPYWKPISAFATAMTLKSLQEGEGARLRLIGLLHGRGFPSSTIDALVKALGFQAYEKIKRDPFVMMIEGVPGCGFKRCDSLYTDLGLPPGRLRRQMLAAWYAIKQSDNGDTWIPRSRAEDLIARYVSGAAIDVAGAVEMGVNDRWLATATTKSGVELITTHSRASDEVRIAAKIKLLNLACSDLRWPNAGQISALSRSQQAVMSRLFESNLFVLLGSAGTGKTHVAAQTIKSVYKHTIAEMALRGSSHLPAEEQFPFFIAAPTGKAVRRLREFLASEKLNVHPRTIHSMLSPRGSGERENLSDWKFFWNQDNKLPIGFYFIDEASMVDTGLMACLIDAIPMGSRVMFIADTHQLPPVGSGAPIRDMVRADVPHGSLTEIYRHGGDMLVACEAIRKGHPRIQKSAELCPEKGRNLWNIASDRPVATLLSLVKNLKKKGHDLHSDIQVITLLNKSGEVNRERLNEAMQKEFNANGQGQKNHPFRTGDKIMCTRNGFVPVCTEPNLIPPSKYRDIASQNSLTKTVHGSNQGPPNLSTKAFLCNGEIGYVVASEPRRLIACFTDPDRVVVLPLKIKGDEEEFGEIHATWTLAYACTVHKAQGSQWPIVILMLPGPHDVGARMLAGRELYYTALSRASLVTFVIGDWSLMEQQVAKAKLPSRRTLLAELLREPEISAWTTLQHHSQFSLTPENSTLSDSETSPSDVVKMASR